MIVWLRSADGSSATSSAVSSEFDLIARIKSRAAHADDSVLVNIGDDAAVLLPEPGLALVATTDSLVLDRHFRADWSPADVGHLALAANLSDLAAMAARPRWALLALTLPDADAAWLDAFLDGFLALAVRSGTRLVGGNLARGPLNISVQLIGEVDPDRMARRGGCQPGDLVMVSGTLGDAAAALALDGKAPERLRQRLQRPEPRLAVGAALGGLASAMMDISDGLLADLGHLLGPGQGAEVEVTALPTSPDLRAAVPVPEQRRAFQLNGGSDYELLWTLAPALLPACRQALAATGTDSTVIGRVREEPGIECVDQEGNMIDANQRGWDHFDG